MNRVEVWLEDGADAVASFEGYDGGNVLLARFENSLYVEVGDHREARSVSLKSKEILRVAHWLIREFTEDNK